MERKVFAFDDSCYAILRVRTMKFAWMENVLGRISITLHSRMSVRLRVQPDNSVCKEDVNRFQHRPVPLLVGLINCVSMVDAAVPKVCSEFDR